MHIHPVRPSRGIVRKWRRRTSAVPIHRRRGALGERADKVKKGLVTKKPSTPLERSVANRQDRAATFSWKLFMARVLETLTKNQVTTGNRTIEEIHTPHGPIRYTM